MARIEQSVAIDETESSETVGGACLEARSLRKVYGSGPDAITVWTESISCLARAK